MFDTLKLLAESLVFKRVIIIYCAYIVTMLDTKYVDDKFQIHRGLHHFRHQHRLSNGSKKPPISIIDITNINVDDFLASFRFVTNKNRH